MQISDNLPPGRTANSVDTRADKIIKIIQAGGNLRNMYYSAQRREGQICENFQSVKINCMYSESAEIQEIL